MNQQPPAGQRAPLRQKNAIGTYAEGERRPDFTRSYYAPKGGLPGQDELMSGRSVFTEAYAFIPRGVMTDIVTTGFPFWDRTRGWIIARPMSGFAETFSQYIMEVEPGRGSARPDPEGGVSWCSSPSRVGEPRHYRGGDLPADAGGVRLHPAGDGLEQRNHVRRPAGFHWIRKATKGSRVWGCRSRWSQRGGREEHRCRTRGKLDDDAVLRPLRHAASTCM